MKKTIFFLPLVLVISVFSISCNQHGPISNLRCEYQPDPISIDVENPRFTWNYDVYEDFTQSGYNLSVSSDEDFTNIIWSTGERESSAMRVQYTGPSLKSCTRYWWKIQYKLSDGKSYCSEVRSFRTAMMPGYDWKGQWISDSNDKSYAPAPMLRKAFNVAKAVNNAFLYISAAAYYKLYLNGEDPSGVMLDPGYTHYDKRNLYSVYDLTGEIKEGDNVIATVLGSGFYNEDKPVATWNFENARWRGRPRMIAELHISYQDGSYEIIPSDSSWTTSTGPYLSDNIYSGDVYDARKELPGWNDVGYDDSSWQKASLVNAPSSLLKAQQCPPIRVKEVISPVNMDSFGDTVFVFDFGKNISGLCSISLSGEEGTEVTLTHGELLTDEGRLQMGNINIYYRPLPGYQMQTDTYYMKGEGREVFSPMFSYHGFRYVEVRTSRPMKITADDIRARFFHTDVAPTGKFTCSNELLNKIHKATQLSYLDNLMSIPTDCPQREKNGWTADAYLAADFAMLNYDGILFYEKWIDDMIDNQHADGNVSGIVPTSDWGYDDWIGPVWAAAWFIIPQTLYDYYGDDTAIRRIWPSCKKYLEYLSSRENAEGTVTYGIGDWLSYDAQTPTDFTTTCFYYYENKIAARFARMNGESDSLYLAKAAALKGFINDKYFDETSCLYSTGTQAAQGVALYMDIVPEQYREKVAANLAGMIVGNGGFLNFGTIGSKTVLRVLSDNGYFNVAYDMASKKTAPSWGAWIESGLTTLAETWVLDMEHFRDASLNHVFFGDVSAWMTSYISGLSVMTDESGKRIFRIRPNFTTGLQNASDIYDSPEGKISVSWRKKGGMISLEVMLPANTEAVVILDEEKRITGGVHSFKCKETLM